MTGPTENPELDKMIRMAAAAQRTPNANAPAQPDDALGFWNTVIDTMSEALIIISPDRRIVYGNRKTEDLLPVPGTPIQGQSCLDAFDCPQCRCQCRLFETGRIDNTEVVIHIPEPRVFRKNGRLLKDANGRVLGGIETFADVTEEYRQRSERQRRDAELAHERRRSEALLEDLRRVTGATPPEATTAERIESNFGFRGMISQDAEMKKLFRLIENVARTDASVLIEGESGTGKELVARAIHALGPAATEPYYAVNCATFTGSLLLSELFGHERGSFTGAYRTQRGKLEQAKRGTLLLDEVSEIPIEHQALLLRVLECRRFERLGGTTPIPLHARVLSATNQPAQRGRRTWELSTRPFLSTQCHTHPGAAPSRATG